MTPPSQDGHNGGRLGQAGPLPARHTPADGRVGYRSAGTVTAATAHTAAQ